MGQVNHDTDTVSHVSHFFAISLLHQTFLEDNELLLYPDVIARSPNIRATTSSQTIHNISHQCQPDGIIPSIVISSIRGSTRVSLLSPIASDPKLLQSFLESKAYWMPNPLVQLIGTHIERRQIGRAHV